MDHRAIMSGQRKDPLAILLRGLLRIGEVPYRIGVARRNRAFDTGRTEIHHCGVPVISIGNLTTGGTGKTPLVCYVARYLRQQQLRVAIVSRGYGAEEGEENDEAAELSRSLPDVPHIQDPDRVAAARIAVEELESEVILMDDGFQHRRLHRDLDMVVIDATNPFGYDHLLPRGLLREPIASLTRAQCIVLSRSDLVDESTRQKIRATVTRYAPQAVFAEAIHEPSGLLTWPDQQEPAARLKGKRVALLCAIGNPDAFAATIHRCGAEIIATRNLPDHDEYSRTTVAAITEWLKSLNDESIEVICTHKDLVKLQTDRLAGHRLSALLIDMTLVSNETPLQLCLDRVIAQESHD
jgi:tetraacyldisaccharide 4'-kinase